MASGNPPKTWKKGLMDRWLEKGNSFVSKHPNLFQGYTFTFKGYAPAVQKALEDVVKKMSMANDGRPHYSIAYSQHQSQKATEYMFAPLQETAANLNCHCLDIKFKLNAKYWPSDDKLKKVKCSLCHETESLGLADLKDDEIFIVEAWMG